MPGPLIPDQRLPILLEAAETILGSRHDACFELREAIYCGAGYGRALHMLRRLSTDEQRAILEAYAETVSAP